MIEVSVILIVKNEADYIKKCLDSILSQSYTKFEIIIIDDNSSDGTKEIIKSFEDKRINLFNFSKEKYPGYANLRNLAIKKSNGKYIFFTDGDCVVHYNWIQEALNYFNTEKCLGVEGRTFYESKSAISISDYFTYRVIPDGYMTCNVAYLKDAIKKVGYFDPKFKYVYEDRDLGIRIKKIGKIIFQKNMIVFHQQKKLTLKNLFIRSRRAGDMVYFDHKHGRKESEYITKNILYINHLIIIIFPPLIFLGSRIESLYDLFFAIVKYFSFFYERFFIWKNSIKYKKLIF